MTSLCESSTNSNTKSVVVRVKRKASQSRINAFWLEINERPLKRSLLDFSKLSISESTTKEELKSKRVFVQHVETVNSTEVTTDILHSNVVNVPPNSDELELKARSGERKHAFKKEIQKHDQLLSKAKEKQEVLANNARFEQIWRRRKGNEESIHGIALQEICDVYDVAQIDIEDISHAKKVQEDMSWEDQKALHDFLPLLRDYLPTAATDIEFDLRAHTSIQTSADDYVYDVYTVKNDMDIVEEDPSNPYPLVLVNNDDFHDGPLESEYESDNSNAEDNPRNEYPDEISDDEEEVESEDSDELKSENDSDSSESMETEESVQVSKCADIFDEDLDAGSYDSQYEAYCDSPDEWWS